MGVDDTDSFECTYEGNGITLKGAEFVPKKQSSLGTIYLIPGISAVWGDYTTLIVPLAKRFRVCTYNQRGHGNSPGRFDVRSAVDDLERIISKESSPVGIIGHSISCKEAVDVAKRFEENGKPLDGVYMIEPFLGIEFLNWPQKAMAHLAYGFTPALRFIDDAFNDLKKLRELNGLNNRDVLASYGALAREKSSDCAGLTTPVGFMLSDNDGTLGTNSMNHYLKCIGLLNKLFPNHENIFHSAEGDSYAAKGLNHCLNLNGFRPFLKLEKGKKREVALFAIETFFYTVFSEKH